MQLKFQIVSLRLTKAQVLPGVNALEKGVVSEVSHLLCGIAQTLSVSKIVVFEVTWVIKNLP